MSPADPGSGAGFPTMIWATGSQRRWTWTSPGVGRGDSGWCRSDRDRLCGCLQLAVSVPLLLLAHHPREPRATVTCWWCLELLVGASFLLGAVVLLWHTRGVPVDPPLAHRPSTPTGQRLTLRVSRD